MLQAFRYITQITAHWAARAGQDNDFNTNIFIAFLFIAIVIDYYC